MLSDPARTGVVVVARPEEMPVNEALALERALAARVGLPVSLVVANALLPDRFSGADVQALGGADGHPAAAVARSAAARARAQRAQLARLRRGTGAPVCRLPFVVAAGLDPRVLGNLADRLERAL